MADFEKAYSKTMGHEGGYVNDPDDAGGETYKGIARRYHPGWGGWIVVDSWKYHDRFPKILDEDATLQSEVHKFYKQHYWDVNLLDKFESQALAEEMFDTGVNMGISRAGKFLQQSLNIFNKNGRLYDDIVEDGAVGPNTLKALQMYMRTGRGDSYLLKAMNVFQGMHYINYMNKSPVQEKYAFGWFNRVEISKKY
jgi:lysozyme family protein